MLPKPFWNYLPSKAKRGFDPARDALVQRMDSFLEEVGEETEKLLDRMRPDKVQAPFIAELGELLSAGIIEEDRERQRRAKVAIAPDRLKKSSTWLYDIKPRIDSVVGGDATIYTEGGYQWVWMEDEAPTPPGAIWGNGATDPPGIDWVIGDEIGTVAGTVAINVDDDSLTADEVDQLVRSIRDSIPVYYEIAIGYVENSEFIQYRKISEA